MRVLVYHMNVIAARERLEIAALGVITLVVLLNSAFFASLSLNRQEEWRLLTDDALMVGAVYLGFLVWSVACIMLDQTKWIKRAFFAFLTVMTIHIFFNLYHLIFSQAVHNSGQLILLDAFIIWTSSMLTFSLWYWILDRGGPLERALNPTLDRHKKHDFHFTQYALKETGWHKWSPKFLDYVSLSFFVATNFSAADVIPLSKPAKVLVMIEAALSLVIIAMVITRAISLL